MKNTIATICLMLCAFPALAQDKEIFLFYDDPLWLQITRENPIRIHTDDQVSDGCWTTVEQSRNAVALELQRSGYSIAQDDEYSDHRLYLFGLGYSPNDGITCFVSLSMELVNVNPPPTINRLHGYSVFSALNFNKMWTRRSIRSGGSQNMSQRIKEDFIDKVQELLLEIPKRKRAVINAIIEATETEEDKEFWRNYPID